MLPREVAQQGDVGDRIGPGPAEDNLVVQADQITAHGIEPELHRFIYTHLQAYEQRRAAKRL